MRRPFVALKSGVFNAARHQAVIAALAFDAHMHALFAAAVLGLFLASFAHVEGPAYGAVVVIKLLVPFQLIRAICLSLRRCFGLLFGLQVPCGRSPLCTLIN